MGPLVLGIVLIAIVAVIVSFVALTQTQSLKRDVAALSSQVQQLAGDLKRVKQREKGATPQKTAPAGPSQPQTTPRPQPPEEPKTADVAGTASAAGLPPFPRLSPDDPAGERHASVRKTLEGALSELSDPGDETARREWAANEFIPRVGTRVDQYVSDADLRATSPEAAAAVDSWFRSCLEELGAQRLPVEIGETQFDGSIHNAVRGFVESDAPNGSIVRVVRPGYRFVDNGELIRKADVHVAGG